MVLAAAASPVALFGAVAGGAVSPATSLTSR